MIDLHNHILPGWDDGPATLDKALDMARQAVSIGTTIMVATPHRYTAGRESLATIVQERVDLLNAHFAGAQIPLEILPGVEVPIDRGIAEAVRGGTLSTLAGGNYVLIEPPFTDLPDQLLDDIRALLDSGLQAVLAHPERNAEVQRLLIQHMELPFVTACAELGCVIQLTSGSIVGRFGGSAMAVSRAIAKHAEWRIVIASDSHDPKERTPAHLAKARDTVAVWTGDAVRASSMVDSLPAEIIGCSR